MWEADKRRVTEDIGLFKTDSPWQFRFEVQGMNLSYVFFAARKADAKRLIF